MTPDEHARVAEVLVKEAKRGPIAQRSLTLARAQVHATLSLRKPEPAPRKKPGPKPKRDPKAQIETKESSE